MKKKQTMYMYSKNEPFEKHLPNDDACLFIYTFSSYFVNGAYYICFIGN